MTRPCGAPSMAAVLVLVLVLVALAAAAAAPQPLASAQAQAAEFRGAGLGKSLRAYLAWLQEQRAAARAGGGGSSSINSDSSNSAAPEQRQSAKRAAAAAAVIPLPGGWGYLNASYFGAPQGCGGPLSNDRQCGAPHAFDAVGYVATQAELVVPKGYPLEAYEVETPDGYLLSLYRIPRGRYRHTAPGPRPAVLLMHGVTLASNCYTVLNANESLAFILADAGFDVWLGNTRGNTYALKHRTLSPYSAEFWRFAIDELALLDLPAIVDFALAAAGASRLGYVGHSQGCTLALMLLAARPEYNAKLSVVAHMGPVYDVDDIAAPFLRFAGASGLDGLLPRLGVAEFLPTRFTAPAAGTLCNTYPFDELCGAAVSFLFYGPSQHVTLDDYAAIGRTWPSGVSSRNLAQWAQNFRARDDELRRYDYGNDCRGGGGGGGNATATAFGPPRQKQQRPWKRRGGGLAAAGPACNLEAYGAAGPPPAYGLSGVTAPQAFFLAEYDVLAMAQDVSTIYSRLPLGAVVAQYEYAGLGHMDLVWDRRAAQKGDLAEVLLRYAPGTF